MNSSKKAKNLTLILSIRKFLDESKCHTVILFVKDILKKGLAAGVSNFKVYLLPDVLIPINDPSKFIKDTGNKHILFEKLNEIKIGGGYRDLSVANKILEYDPNHDNFLLLFADERVTIPYGQCLPTVDKGLFSSVFTVKVKNQENHYYHKLSEFGFNNIFLINDFKDLDVGFEPLKKGSFLSQIFFAEKKIDISMSELIEVEETEEQLRDIARMNEEPIEYSGFTNKMFQCDAKYIESVLRKSTSSTSTKSDNSEKKVTTPTVPENLISPSKSDGPVITDFGPDSPLVLSEKMNSTPNMEEYKMDMNTPGEQKKVFEQVEVKYDTSIIKKASSPNTSIVSESQAVSPPSSKTSTLTSNLDLKSKVESSMQESPAEEVLCIWDNKLDFVKNSYIKGLPTKTDHLNLSEFNFDNEYTQPIIILLLNQFGALGREKEEFCNNLLKKFDKKLKLAYISMDSKIPSLDLFYSDKKKVESVRALYSKIKDKFAMEAKEATKLNGFLSNLLSNKK